jgi:hypothetical protein
MSTVALIFVAVWALGSISSLTMGGLLHVFLVVAIGMMLPRVVLGRKAAQ